MTTDGIPLIENMAYVEGWKSKARDWLLGVFLWVYGLFLRARRMLLGNK